MKIHKWKMSILPAEVNIVSLGKRAFWIRIIIAWHPCLIYNVLCECYERQVVGALLCPWKCLHTSLIAETFRNWLQMVTKSFSWHQSSPQINLGLRNLRQEPGHSGCPKCEQELGKRKDCSTLAKRLYVILSSFS